MEIITIVLIALLGVSIYFNYELFSIARELKERLGAYGDNYIPERAKPNN